MKPLKEKISITLDNDLLERIRYLAEYDFVHFIGSFIRRGGS